ncbi:ORF335 [White spot syndrome virus]|uniref:ORF335 n=1 Tax=White spot syndrome virus TaxID=342409 RepID=A0A2D3I621_9VIRU|nr:ORF335 [White spot syndrome virus]
MLLRCIGNWPGCRRTSIGWTRKCYQFCDLRGNIGQIVSGRFEHGFRDVQVLIWSVEPDVADETGFGVAPVPVLLILILLPR